MGNTLNTFGKPVFAQTPTQTVADLQAAADFTDTFANLRSGTTTQRNALTAGQVRAGMLFTDTTDRGVYRYDGSGFVGIGNRVAVFDVAITGFTDNSLAGSAIGSGVSAIASETTDSSFITARTGTACTVNQGLYLVSIYASLAGGNSFTGRALAEIAAGSTLMNRANGQAGVGENGWGVVALVPIPTAGTVIEARLLKVSGTTPNVTGRLTLVKLA